jgi:hypothetical protein
VHTAWFWCGCQEGYEKSPPEKCKLHGDTVERVEEEPVVEKPEPKMKSKTRVSKR